MVDTLELRITKADVPNTNFLTDVLPKLYNITEHINKDRESVYYTGYLQGTNKDYRVILNENKVSLKECSLVKWHTGDNMKVLKRQDIELAIESLADTIHLPIEQAKITRLDVAQNFIMKQPVEVYLQRLGLLPRFSKFQMENSLLYQTHRQRLSFYDKKEESKNKGVFISELFKGKNVLRYEQRYITDIANQFQKAEIRAKDLYEEGFYIKLLDNWLKRYNEIEKDREITYNFEEMNTKKELYQIGILALVEKFGETNLLEIIKAKQTNGEITKKQAFDIRKEIQNTIQTKAESKADVIQELNKKVKETITFYR